MFSAKKFKGMLSRMFLPGSFPSTVAPLPYSDAYNQSAEDRERQLARAEAKRMRKEQRRIELAEAQRMILHPGQSWFTGR